MKEEEEMRRLGWMLALSLLATVLAACNYPDSGSDQGAELVASVSTALADGDAERLGSFFTSDGVLAAAEPTGEILRGTNQITEYYGANFPHLKVSLSLTQKEFQRLGEGSAVQTGSIRGLIVRKADGVEIPTQGNFIHLLRPASNQSWQISRAIWGFEHDGQPGLFNEDCKQCCCKTVSGCDCKKRTGAGCPKDFPISVVKP